MNVRGSIQTNNNHNYSTVNYNTINRKPPNMQESKAGGSNTIYAAFKNSVETKSTYFNRTNQSTVTITNANNNSNSTAEKNNKTVTENKFKQKKDEQSEYRLFTGTAERIIKWNKVYKNFCYYEVISSIISIQESRVKLQKIMLLKDKKGPILQVVHYVNDHINIEDFHVGQTLRCVGRMIGPNILHAVSIRAAHAAEVENLQRICYICDHAVTKAI